MKRLIEHLSIEYNPCNNATTCIPYLNCHFFLETLDRQNGGSGRKGTADPRERKIVRRTQTHPCSSTRSRGCWTTANLPADVARENKADEGMEIMILSSLCGSFDEKDGI